MKKILALIFITLFSFLKGNAQITNLNDLLKISELSVKEMLFDLPQTWKLKQPVKIDSDEFSETKHYVFINNSDAKKQVIRKSGRFQFKKNETYWLTDFQCNDLVLLDKIKRDIIANGFTINNEEENRIVYTNTDGSKAIIIRTKNSDNEPSSSFIYKDFTNKDENSIKLYEIRIVN